MMSGDDGVEMVSAYCAEVARVLRDKGSFVVMTHLDPDTEEAAGVLYEATLRASHFSSNPKR